MMTGLSLTLVYIVLVMQQINPLAEYRWKNRIVILYSQENPSTHLTRQIRHFESDPAGFEERDLLIFRLFKDAGYHPDGRAMSSSGHDWLTEKYALKEHNFQIILIGKDGGVKLRAQEPVANHKLFSLIDSMPMRIQEMKN